MLINKKLLFSFITIFLIGIWANLAQIAGLRIFLGFLYGSEIHISLFIGLWLLFVSLGSILTSTNLVKSLDSSLSIMIFSPFICIGLLYLFFSYIPLVNESITGTLVPFDKVLYVLLLIIVPLATPVGMTIPLAVKSYKTLKLGNAYYYESLGSFFGGILFSIILQGKSNSIETLMTIPILILTAKFLNSNFSNRTSYILLGIITMFLPFIVAKNFALVKNRLEKIYWRNVASSYDLVGIKETKYQKINLLKYAEQYSLYSNGQLVTTWPNEAKIKEKIHSFLTSVNNPKNIGIIGIPTFEFLQELCYWSPSKITIIDLDKELLEYTFGKTLLKINKNSSSNIYKVDLYFNNISTYSAKVVYIKEDPRVFHKKIEDKFDALFVLHSEPITLLSNRLFTVEGIRDLKKLLKNEGVINLSITGGENYFSSETESIIFSTYKSLKNSFKEIQIIPGDPIHFWATDDNKFITNDPKLLESRYNSLGIRIPNFDPKFFYSIFLDYRINEIKKIIEKVELKSNDRFVNKDYHPAIFIRQLQLWNKLSDSIFAKIVRFLELYKIPQFLLLLLVLIITLFVFKIIFGRNRESVLTLLAVGVGISGSVGLLTEIILVLVYQNRFGLVFYMSAFFFGIYMLGLAVGAYLGEKLGLTKFINLIFLKFAQLCMIIICLIIVLHESFQTFILISLGIFTIAFLDGIEFPSVDSIYRRNNFNPAISASILTFCDNFGASIIGFLVSIWLIPVYGYVNILYFASAILFTNLVLLILSNIFLNKHILNQL